MPNSPNNALPMQAAALSLEDLATRSGIHSEHVLIESEEIFEQAPQRTHCVQQRFMLRNRIRGAETVFTLFDDGFLSVKERRNGRLIYEHTVNLHCLDPRPVRSRFAAKRALYTALASIGFGLAAGMLAYFAVLPKIMVLLSAGSILAAAAALIFFVRRTREQIMFRTLHGRAIVLSLIANFGCFRACRAHAHRISAAIHDARRQNRQEKQNLLREEMREHYRLSETGVLSAQACSAAVRRTLAHFD